VKTSTYNIPGYQPSNFVVHTGGGNSFNHTVLILRNFKTICTCFTEYFLCISVHTNANKQNDYNDILKPFISLF